MSYIYMTEIEQSLLNQLTASRKRVEELEKQIKILEPDIVALGEAYDIMQSYLAEIADTSKPYRALRTDADIAKEALDAVKEKAE